MRSWLMWRMACWIWSSVALSMALVLSSRIRMRGSVRKRARDGDALALPAGERHAALADFGLVALGKAGDEIVGLGRPGRRSISVLAGAGAAKGDVLGQRAREQEDILLDGRDLRAQRLQAPVAHVDAIDQHAAGIGIEDAVDQPGECGLARAGLADDGDGFAGPCA